MHAFNHPPALTPSAIEASAASPSLTGDPLREPGREPGRDPGREGGRLLPVRYSRWFSCRGLGHAYKELRHACCCCSLAQVRSASRDIAMRRPWPCHKTAHSGQYAPPRVLHLLCIRHHLRYVAGRAAATRQLHATEDRSKHAVHPTEQPAPQHANHAPAAASSTPLTVGGPVISGACWNCASGLQVT